MKLWKKIYIITLLLSILIINSGIFMVFNMTYKENIASEKDKSKVIFNMLYDTTEKNMTTLYGQSRLYNAQIVGLLKIYEKYYGDEEIFLGIKYLDEWIYPEEEGSADVEFSESGKGLMTVKKIDNVTTIYITKTIEIDEKVYYFYYEKPLKEFSDTWKRMKKQYLMMSMAVSVVLAAALVLVLKRLTKPVTKLSDAVNRMKEGGFDSYVHVKISGNDDIAMLGTNFNEMSDIIAGNVKVIREENAKKQQFVDDFAHELKTPLTSIYGYAEYVKNISVTDEQRIDFMQIIMDECNRMLAMAHSLLDLSELREEQVLMEELEVDTLMKKVKNSLSNMIEKKKINFTWITEKESILGNPDLMLSLIVNLVKNAVNACEEGGEVSVSILKDQGDFKIIVSDNGHGMDESELKHILEPFYRVDKSRSRKNGGNGLGLTLCDKIVKAHGGTLNITSEKNVGTSVTVILKN